MRETSDRLRLTDDSGFQRQRSVVVMNHRAQRVARSVGAMGGILRRYSYPGRRSVRDRHGTGEGRTAAESAVPPECFERTESIGTQLDPQERDMKTKMLVRCVLVAAFGSLLASAPAFARQGIWRSIAWGLCWEAPYFTGNSCQFNYQGKLWQIDRVLLFNRTPGAVCGSYGQWGIQGPPVPRISPTPCWGCQNQIYREHRLVMVCN